MKRLLLGTALALWMLGLATVATASPHEARVMTVAAETTTQTSAKLDKPRNKRGAIIALRCTVGATVSLTLKVNMYFEGSDFYKTWAQHGTVVTDAVADIRIYIYPGSITGVALNATDDVSAMLPNIFQIEVTHGNANAATYTVDVMWLD